MKLSNDWRRRTLFCQSQQKRQQGGIQEHAQQGSKRQKLLNLKNNVGITIPVALLLLCVSLLTAVLGFQLQQQQQQHTWRRSLHVLYHHHHHQQQQQHDNNERRPGCTDGWNNPKIATTIVTSLFEVEKENDKGSETKDGASFKILPLQRRRILHSLAVASLAALSSTTTMLLPLSSFAASFSSLSASSTHLESSSSSTFASSATTLSTAATPSTTTTTVAAPTFISPDQATITDKVYMNVRISRQDGTFYVRDDLPDTPENKVFYGRLVFALFGQEAPRHVEKFKSYILPPKTTTALDNDDDPLPSYDRSTFTSFDQATGVLVGGKIPSLELTEMAGSTALRYGGRLLPASLWLEQRSSTKSRTIISHSARGLLTHRQLEALPDFGITTRSDTTMLDLTHVVFGKLVLDDDAQAFLNIVSNLPTYGMERPNPINNEDDLLLASSGSSSNKSNNPTSPLVDDAAAAVFKAQRQFFRKAAKALGDSRLDKLYEGKLLRRVEVTSTGIV